MVNICDPNSARCIREAQNLLNKASIEMNLAFIKGNLGLLAGSIKQLEDSLPLSTSLAIVEDAHRRIKSIPGEKGNAFKEKINSVLQKNPDQEVLKKVDKVLRGENEAVSPEDMDPDDMYCPIAC